MSLIRHIVAKYHLFLFLVIKDNFVLTSWKLKIIEIEISETTVKTIISNNSKMDLYRDKKIIIVEIYSIAFPFVIN